MMRSFGNHHAQWGSRKKLAIIAKLFEREMLAFSACLYWLRYNGEEDDTETLTRVLDLDPIASGPVFKRGELRCPLSQTVGEA